MEQNFENTNEKKKLGGGIITLAVLTFIGTAISLFTNINGLSSLDTTNKILQEAGLTTISSTQLIMNIVVSVVSTLGFILILRWNKIGVYLYYASFVLGLIVSFISLSSDNGLGGFVYFKIAFSLIIPILLAIFLRNKFRYFK
ncbi:MAG: hypothetical protein AB6733_20765 [Clostridiaceae bacterium]